MFVITAHSPKLLKNCKSIHAADEVLEVVTDGEEKGCKEALITLGDKPELRYKTARDYLSAMALNTPWIMSKRLQSIFLIIAH